MPAYKYLIPNYWNSILQLNVVLMILATIGRYLGYLDLGLAIYLDFPALVLIFCTVLRIGSASYIEKSFQNVLNWTRGVKFRNESEVLENLNDLLTQDLCALQAMKKYGSRESMLTKKEKAHYEQVKAFYAFTHNDETDLFGNYPFTQILGLALLCGLYTLWNMWSPAVLMVAIIILFTARSYALKSVASIILLLRSYQSDQSEHQHD